MSFDSIKFGKIIWEDKNFSLTHVNTNLVEGSYIALVSKCLKLRKIIPSIPKTIEAVSLEMGEKLGREGYFASILETGITQDLNPFLVTKIPNGQVLSQYEFRTSDEFLLMIRELSCSLIKLHECKLFQRELSSNFDVYFDGKKTKLAFPAARDIFHKAYIGAGSKATVFDIPRFIIFPGNVSEDVNAVIELALEVIEKNKINFDDFCYKALLEFFEGLKIQIATSKEVGNAILLQLSELSEIPALQRGKKDESCFEFFEEDAEKNKKNRVSHVIVPDNFSNRNQIKLEPTIENFPRKNIIWVLKEFLAKIPVLYKKIFLFSISITIFLLFLLIFFTSDEDKKSELSASINDDSAQLDLKSKVEEGVVVSDQSEIEKIEKVELQKNDPINKPNNNEDSDVPLLDPKWYENENLEEGEKGKEEPKEESEEEPKEVIVRESQEESLLDNKIEERVEVKKEMPVDFSDKQIEAEKLKDSKPNHEQQNKVENKSPQSSTIDLEKLIKSQSFEDRIKAIKFLSLECTARKEDTISQIETLLLDPDILVRGFAVHAYGKCLGKDAKARLQQMQKQEESLVVKKAIEKALRRL